jgi:hypothetical protein
VQPVIIRLSLLLIAVAIAIYALALSLELLALNRFSDLTGYIGGLLLLCAFFLLLFCGLSLAVNRLVKNVIDFFSRSRRLERNFLYHLACWDRLNRMLYFQKAKITYVNRQQRKNLFEKQQRQADEKLSPAKKRHDLTQPLTLFSADITTQHHD